MQNATAKPLKHSRAPKPRPSRAERIEARLRRALKASTQGHAARVAAAVGVYAC